MVVTSCVACGGEGGWRRSWGLAVCTKGGDKTPNKVLIVIVGVEIGEVGIGVSLPGQLRVKVLVSFLQDQVVLVEGL